MKVIFWESLYRGIDTIFIVGGGLKIIACEVHEIYIVSRALKISKLLSI